MGKKRQRKYRKGGWKRIRARRRWKRRKGRRTS